MLQWSTTAVHANQHGVKVCVYGRAGAGKTTLIATAPRPIIFSAESGTLSIASANIPMAEVKTIADLNDALAWCKGSPEAKNFDTVCLDSVSEIAERLLSDKKANLKDPRAAYGDMQDQIAVMLRQFRDLSGKHVYFTAKCELRDTPEGLKMWGPSMPGKGATKDIPYFFDEFFHLGFASLPDPSKPGQMINYRFLQTAADNQYEAKDRSGALLPQEEPNLAKIFAKIQAHVSVPPAPTSV